MSLQLPSPQSSYEDALPSFHPPVLCSHGAQESLHQQTTACSKTLEMCFTNIDLFASLSAFLALLYLGFQTMGKDSLFPSCFMGGYLLLLCKQAGLFVCMLELLAGVFVR